MMEPPPRPLLPSPPDRFGVYMDPFGQIWSVSNSSSGTLEDVPKELARKVIAFVSVRDCAAYMTFLEKAFGATVSYPPAKDPTGKVRPRVRLLLLALAADAYGHVS